MSNASGGITLLVVEDFAPTSLLLRQVFEKAGFRVLHAPSVAEGFAIAREAAPDLILMDVNLTDGSGFDLTRLLKKDPKTARIPVIALSAMHPAHLREHAMAAGCQDYLSKPFKIYDLTWRIQHWLTKDQPVATVG